MVLRQRRLYYDGNFDTLGKEISGLVSDPSGLKALVTRRDVMMMMMMMMMKSLLPTWAVGASSQGCGISKHTTADARLRGLFGGVSITHN